MGIKISDDASSPAGDRPVKVNTYVSLNMKHRQFYGLDTFVLSADKPTAKVTSDVSKEDRILIQKSIDLGFLIKSKEHIAFVDKPSDLMEDLKIRLDTCKNVKELHPHIVPVVSGKIAKNYGARAVIEELVEYEQARQNRQRILEYFEFALNNIPGPGKIVDTTAYKKKVDVGMRTADIGMRAGAETSPNKDLI
jgi:hypothetical protein